MEAPSNGPFLRSGGDQGRARRCLRHPRVPRSLEALYGLPAHPYAGSTRGSLDGVRPGAWGPGLWANKMDADDAGRTELDYREL